jgi:type I restriction enzyme M protein
MNFRFEIQDMLRSKGIGNSLEINKAIFGIASIGLLIGKEKLDTIIHDTLVKEDRTRFTQEVLSDISKEEDNNIARLAFMLIPNTWSGEIITRITDIILEFDLKHIILDLNIYDYAMGKDCPLASVSWINELVIEILKVHGGKTLYNVDCGTSDFIFGMFQNSNIEKAIGLTYSEENYIISKIKALFTVYKFDVVKEKFFTPSLINDEKVDMAYNSYPLMLKYEKEEIISMIDSWSFPDDTPLNFEKKYSANLLWIINSLQSIKPDGVVVAIVPNGVLFNSIDTDIRKYLVENNYIDTIIFLPTGILPFSGVASSLVILKKNIPQCHSIKMIDATEISCLQRRGKTFTQEDIAYIVELYKSEGQTEKSFNVTLDEIVKNDFYLGFGRYCSYSLINPCQLGNVTRNIFRGYQINAKELDQISIDNEEEDSEYRIINISDIRAEGFVSRELKAVRIEDTRKFNKYCVKDGDIIITAKNTTIKSAIYRSNVKYKAILTGNLIAIRVNETKLNPYYLKAFLDSQQGESVIKSIQTGTSIITLNPNSLKEMKISLLDMSLQSEIAEEYMKNLNYIEDLLEKYNEAFDYSAKIFDTVIKQIE